LSFQVHCESWFNWDDEANSESRESVVKDSEEVVTKDASEPRFFYGYVTVAAVFFILMAALMPQPTYGVFFDSLIREFGWSRTVISGASALKDIAFGSFCIITARLCERFNPRVIVSIYGVLMGLSYFLMSQIDSIWQLYFFFGILTAFSMSVFVAVLSIVARWFVKRRGLMTGVVISGFGLLLTIGPPVANWLIVTYGWRQAFLILGIAAMVIIVLAAQFLKRDPRQVGQLPYGVSSIEQHVSGTWGLSLSEALRTRQLWLICGMYFAFCFCGLVVLVHIVIHGIDMGLTPANAANILAIYGIVNVVSLNLMGISGDRFGNRRTFAICFLLMAISFSWLLVASKMWQFFIFAIILALSCGTQVLFSPLVAEVFGLKSHGVILGIANVCGSIGAAGGPLLAGYMFDKSGSYSIAFIVCIAVAVIAVVFTLLLRALPRKETA
jgi:MFS family permease